MSHDIPIPTSLYPHLGQSAVEPERLAALREQCWQLQGIAVIDPADVRDDSIRRLITQEAERLYGRRNVNVR